MRHTHPRWFRLFLLALLGCGLLAALGAPPAARALEIDDDGVIAPDEVVDDDLIISGARVVVDGVVNGNLIVMGSFITINGRVNGDLIIIGGEDIKITGLVNGNAAVIGRSLQVNGVVGGSVFVLGMQCDLGPAAEVGRNVLLTGLALYTAPGSQVGRDVWVNGYQALLNGETTRDVQADVGALEIGGRVGRNVLTKVAAPGDGVGFTWPGMPPLAPSGLRVAPDAVIEGELAYASPVEQADAIRSQPQKGVTYEYVPASTAAPTLEARIAGTFAAWVRELITLLFLGGLIVWRKPGLLDRLADQAQNRWLPSAGWGLLISVAGYLIAPVCLGLVFIVGLMLAIVTFGGLARLTFGLGLSGLGLGVTLFWFLLAYGSRLIAAYLVGRLLLLRLAPQRAGQAMWPLTLGVVIYTTLHAIPGFGLLIGFLAAILGVGAAWLLYRQRRVEGKPTEGYASLAAP